MFAEIDRRRAAQSMVHGVSIIEMMVGMLVGLLVALTATGSAQLFAASQRQAVGVGGASVNVASILAAIKSDVSNAGLGFFGDSTFSCTTVNVGSGLNLVSDGAAFAPMQAVRVGTNDSLSVIYGSDVAAGAAVPAVSTSATSASLNSMLPTAVGQAVMVAPTDGLTPCTVRTATAVTAATPSTKEILTFANTGLHNQAAFTSNAVYPLPTRIAQLGELLWRRYEISNGNLVMTNLIDGTNAILLRNVIGFRVEYGASADVVGSTTIGSWESTVNAGWTSISNANIQRLRAVRIGVVVRSPQREKANTAGICEASTAKPTLFGNTIEPDVTDWKCFRYRSIVVVAPMRNIIYGLMSS